MSSSGSWTTTWRRATGHEALALLLLAPALMAETRPRARELGIAPGSLPTGALNAITDVAGVRVGHVTLIEGSHIRTGVTAILPHGGNLFQQKVPAAIHVGNGFGKLVGSTQVEELGVLETPIILTNTLSVWRAAEAVAEYMLSLPGNDKVVSVNPLVGETNDAGLNDIRGFHVEKRHVLEAIRGARDGPVEEGSVGAGTGTQAFGFKGGIGTSSRRAGPHTVGALVQSNFGGSLVMDGIPVGRELGRPQAPGDGSLMMVLATGASLDARQLARLARRALLGMARTGSVSAHGSGDYVIAFSTAASGPTLRDEVLTPLFQAAVESTEEVIYNSLLKATSAGSAQALPIDRLKEILAGFQAR